MGFKASRYKFVLIKLLCILELLAAFYGREGKSLLSLSLGEGGQQIELRSLLKNDNGTLSDLCVLVFLLDMST